MISQALSNYNNCTREVEPVFIKNESEDETPVVEEVESKSLWSHSDDLVLIENYPKYKELNKK